MRLDVDLARFTYAGGEPFDLSKHVQALPKRLYRNKRAYRELIEEFGDEIDELQSMMYAHDRYAMLVIFQAMDAAGKDGTIRHVMRGVNPHGITVHPFKRPSDEELDHDFLWRTNKALPQRGRIAIFNRSYYEEVLVTRVHPKIVTRYQKLPREKLDDLDALWKERYETIRNLERHLHENGTRVVKFFLNVSADEQRRRFLDRIDEADKNWKFSEGDIEERKHWGAYMRAYEDCIAATATPDCPWYVIPADDKKDMRLIVSKVILDRMLELDLHYPVVTDARRTELARYRSLLDE